MLLVTDDWIKFSLFQRVWDQVKLYSKVDVYLQFAILLLLLSKFSSLSLPLNAPFDFTKRLQPIRIDLHGIKEDNYEEFY